MPIYQYHCNRHGTFEIFQGMDDIHESICPVCSQPMRRILLPSYVKTEDASMGKSRDELIDNLALEGRVIKDWRYEDKLYKQQHGIED